MMITIHGLPPRTTFQAVKALVKQECNIIDFILDNLVDDGPKSKKVRIGVSDDTEGYRLMKCLDGFRMSPSHLLKIVPVGKSLNVPPQQNYDQRSGFSNQPRNDYSNQSRPDYQNQPMNDYGNRGGPGGGPHGPRGPIDSGSRQPGPGGHGNQDGRHYGGPDQRHMDHGPDSRGPLRPPEIRLHGLDQRHHGPPDNRHQAPHGSLDNRNPQGPQDAIRGQPWGPNVNSPNNQWGNQGPGGQLQSQSSYNQRPEAGFGPQHPQGSDHYGQGRGPPDQGYGFPSKPNVPERVAPARETRQHVLRSVEIVDTPRPYQHEKPVTIMKDNFQGPSQYNAPGQQQQRGNFPPQEQGPISAWAQPGQQNKPNQPYNDRRHPADKRPDMPKQIPQGYDKRDHFSPPRNQPEFPNRNAQPPNVGRNYQEPASTFPVGDRRISPARRLGPPVREFSPSGRRISPTGRRISPTGRRISPSGRRISPTGRRISPTGRRVSPPARRISPTDRRLSPPGRKMSPPGRRISPPGRRVSPPGRRLSPNDRRISPPGRKMSPGRRMSPGRVEPRRISPSMMLNDFYLKGERRVGRRDSPRRFSPKRVSPGPTRRLASPPPRGSRFSPNRLGDKTVDKFMDDGKIVKPVRPAYEPAQAQNQTYTGGYRDSAPYGGRSEPWADKIIYPSKKDDERRDMARRPDIMEKSPGRLSRSPRRERSPLKDRYRRHSPSPRSSRSPRRSWALEKRSSPEPIREPPPPPIWPGQDPDKRKRFEETKREPVWEMTDRRSEEPRPFESKLRVRTDLENKFASSRPSPRDDDDRPKFSRESPRRDEKKPFSDIDKDFQDIYKRAVEFRKKTEERKSGERRRDDYEERYRPTAREDSPRRDRKEQKVEWNTQDRKRILLTPSVKTKRDKAVEEISNRIIEKYKINGDQRYRVMEELKVALHNIFMEMFSNKDVSFIELVIKYQARYDAKEEEKLMHDVLSRLPSQFRNLKRKTAADTSEVPSKTSRRSPQRNAREEARPKLSDAVIPDWNTGLEPPKVMTMSYTGVNAMNPMMDLSNPVMVPPPVYVPTHVNLQQQQVYQTQQQLQQIQQFGGNQMQPQFGGSPVVQQQFDAHSLQQQQFGDSSMQQQPQFEPAPESTGLYNLYLCQDDFEPFSAIQAEYLKNFLVNQIVKETENSNGWAPDITLKGLQSLYRYELCTKDEMSKDWILNLNFAEFEFFNVLVYTKEELWYERAAIWLPGHSRKRNIEPLDKLKMQNKRLDGVNLCKWKCVKKIITAKGTRLYVDMPPSSARALEKHKMMLSYELQKVNVFLKAVAVDKDSFDAGLKEPSITDRSLLVSAVQNSPMPTLNANTEPGIVKIGINGQKSLTVEQARKVKDVIVYFLFKYLQVEGLCSKTDFVKYGYCSPCYLGIVPENPESKRWLMSRHFGKLNRHNIVVLGIDDDNTKYFKMIAYIPHEYHTSTHLAFERLKQSNQGIKGIHFNLWKPIRIVNDRKKAMLELELDLESVEVLSKMKYKLDYVGEFGIQVVDFKSEYSLTKLEEKIRKCKMEQVDSYDVANMELGSDSEREDVICLD